MSADDLRRRKRALRRHIRELRDALPEEERGRRSEVIARHVLALPALADPGTVMAFSSFGSEVDTRPLIQGLLERATRVVLPRVEGHGIVAVASRPGDPMRRTAFGALEPAGGDVLGPEELDVILTPGLAFDRRGFRLGYGRGFYDRFLRRLRPDVVTIGIAFSLQVVEEVPHGRGDRAVDTIVTEEGATPSAT